MKPALTFDEQLDHLIKDKKLIVGNKKNALRILKYENYYRLSGYMIDFLNEEDRFMENTSFEQIYDVYKADKEIRSALFKLINDIEVYLKTQIANYYGLKYGPIGYLEPNNFNLSKQTDYCDIIDLLKMCSDINNNLIVKHHINAYNGYIPVWALVELMPFGMISKFYSMLKTTKKSYSRTLALMIFLLKNWKAFTIVYPI